MLDEVDDLPRDDVCVQPSLITVHDREQRIYVSEMIVRGCRKMLNLEKILLMFDGQPRSDKE